MEIELTGRTKYTMRRRLFRKAVPELQVEERRVWDHWSSLGGQIDVETIDRTHWRPATVADLLNLQKDGMLSQELGDRMAAMLEI